MREYKIYYRDANEGSADFLRFAREIEQRINDDEHIINMAKDSNRKLAEKITEILANDDNEIYVGAMVLGAYSRTPRYAFIKNLEYDGTDYEAVIDLLEQRFWLVDVD